MATTLAGSLRDELSALLAPLATVASPSGFLAMLQSLGHADGMAKQSALFTALQQVAALADELGKIEDADLESWEGVARVLKAARDFFTAVRTVEQAVTDPTLAEQAKDLGLQIANRLIALYLRAQHPTLYRAAMFLTLVGPAEMAAPSALVVSNGQILRMPWVDDRFHLERMGDLISKPWPTLRDAYFPNALAHIDDAFASANLLLPLLGMLGTALGLRSYRDLYALDPPAPPSSGDESFGDHFADDPSGNAPPAADESAAVRALRMPRLTAIVVGSDGAQRLGITATISSAEHAGGVAGVIFGLDAGASWSDTIGNWKLDFGTDGQIPAFVFGPNGDVSLAPVTTALTSATGHFSIARVTADGAPAFLFGSATGTRIELGQVQAEIDFALSPVAQTISLTLAVSKAVLAVVPGDGDGFLQSVLPAGGLKADFDLGIVASSNGGLTIRGAAGLDATLPIGLSLGPLSVPTMHLGLLVGNDGAIAFETSASLTLSIGPVQAVVDRIGLLTNVTFPTDGGNLGPADFSLGFKFPSGVGLNVDAAGVTGGGYLGYNPAANEYFGVLQLRFIDLALQAFGLITTQVAGAAGYSLLAMVDADFPPVPLGWGFTLNGVGGLFAMHRTANVDALRAALKADALSTILFPKNAITSAPQILAQLETLFPTAPGRFLFGPMALIGWGTPTVLTAALAVILELPEPIRILLLARVAVRAPSESAPLVRINMDALGVLDLSNDAFSLDAVLYDSRLLNYTLSGGMALRANWGSKREFLLAIGGFHPQFTPPAGFPALQRITIDMPSGIVSKLRLSAYLALTSNTVQFGAELDVFVGADGFGLSGTLAFDALFQFDPFHFDTHLTGSVSIQFAGDDLASVSFDGDLSGPAPWHIAGSFKIHIVFWDVHKSFSHSWGSDAPSQTVVTVDVLGLLSATLADPRSWAARLPDGTAALVTLRAAAGNTPAIVVHPLGLPEVHERIVPLDMDITRFGTAVPAGATRYSITDWRLGGVSVPQEEVEDDFAPAQFLDLSDDEKLARPSYEQHDAGVKMSGGLVKSGSAVAKTLAYETSYIDTPGGELRGDPAPAPPLVSVLGILSLGSAGRAQAMSQAYWAAGNPVTVTAPQFVIVGTDTLAPVGIGPAAGATYSDVASMLAAELARAPERRGALQIVGTHERVAA